MKLLEKNPYSLCDFGDKRLTRRAVSIGEHLFVKYGQPLSKIFDSASDLKRSYEFFSNPKTTFDKLTQPHFKQTAQEISGVPVVLAVGDTSFLDYKKILKKRDDYGPTGNGGNGLILHSCLALDPDFGQPLGLLWEKLWHREKKQKTPKNEEPEQKKQRLQQKRKAQRKKAFEEKESYRWVEAFQKISKLFNSLENPVNGLLSKVIHVFDREGDIAEVFARVSQNKNTGVVVRAAHNRCLSGENSHLWEYLYAQKVQCILEVELPQTSKRKARTATLEIKFCPISIKPPSRLKNEGNFDIYAVYAREINVPDDCEPVEWMLLTTESVTTQQDAETILRYRFNGESMSTMRGFLTVIAAQLFRITYLHRTSPQTSATEVLTKTQMDVLIATTPPKVKKEMEFTIDWAIRAVARLGGYLEHRKNSAIGIQVLWRGWLELETLCQGWLLRSRLNF